MVSHLFPTKQPVYAVGQKLFAPVATALTFNAYDFVPNLTNTSRVNKVNWDFGDGSINLTDGTTTPGSAVHTYAEPGTYTIACQVLYGLNASAPAEVAQSIQTSSREIEVFITLAQIKDSALLPWVASIHDSFRDDASGEVRHTVVVMPLLSAVVTDSAVGATSWGSADSLTLTDALLAQAVDDGASRLQASYATGLGRMAFPTGQLEQAVWAEFSLESIAIGTNDTVSAKMAAVENAWREFARGAGDGHRVVSMATALTDVFTNITAGTLTSNFLKQLPWTPTTNLSAGTSSVRTADAMRWLEYRNQEVDDRQTQAATTNALWRRMASLYTDEAPTFDPNTAWAWETAQAVAQCVYAFYFALDPAGTNKGGNMQSAQILALGDPKTRSLTVYLTDSTSKVWAVWQVGLVAGTAGTPSLAQMRGQTDGSLAGGNFVGARGVAYGTTGNLANNWDIRRLESLLTPELRSATSTYGGTVTTIANVVAQASADLLTVTLAYPQDGAVRRYATPSTGLFAADVVRPAIAIDAFDAKRGGLRPHAALAVALGKGFGVRAGSNTRDKETSCGVCADKSQQDTSGFSKRIESTPLLSNPVVAEMLARNRRTGQR